MRIEPSKTFATLLALLILSSGCDALERPASAEQPAKTDANVAPTAPPKPEPPPEPPEPGPRHWVIPDVGASESSDRALIP